MVEAKSELRAVLRWTLGSALGWGALFVLVAGGGAISAGVQLLDVLPPVLAFGLIGFTVGGLVGPLLRGLWLRRSSG